MQQTNKKLGAATLAALTLALAACGGDGESSGSASSATTADGLGINNQEATSTFLATKALDSAPGVYYARANFKNDGTLSFGYASQGQQGETPATFKEYNIGVAAQSDSRVLFIPGNAQRDNPIGNGDVLVSTVGGNAPSIIGVDALNLTSGAPPFKILNYSSAGATQSFSDTRSDNPSGFRTTRLTYQNQGSTQKVGIEFSDGKATFVGFTKPRADTSSGTQCTFDASSNPIAVQSVGNDINAFDFTASCVALNLEGNPTGDASLQPYRVIFAKTGGSGVNSTFNLYIIETTGVVANNQLTGSHFMLAIRDMKTNNTNTASNALFINRQ